MSVNSYLRYTSKGGVSITRQSRACDGVELEARLCLLDTHPGVLLSCSSEYPGRYQKRDVLIVNPPLRLTARQNELVIDALNARGRILLPAFEDALSNMQSGPAVTVSLSVDDKRISARIQADPAQYFLPEEMRTRRPGLFDLLRALINYFSSDQDHNLGFYGAFAYDLAFQLESVQLRLPRSESQRDLVLYLPDEILLHDPVTGSALLHSYDFVCTDASGRLQTTGGLKRQVVEEAAQPHAEKTSAASHVVSDHAPGEYAAVVEKAREYFARGDLFEAVPGQTFSMQSSANPSALFRMLRASNPAPYGALINLGQQEFLISASPEMFVRVKNSRVESCPISGTIARGVDALEDAVQIQTLLQSEKDAAELSMCTDVDRNDKSRVCVPGSVRIIGRRQVELYSRLIHTVDHVEGLLQPSFDALDAFLTHTWAVTVTGAPKLRAMQFIEDHEKTARGWYGGAFGYLGFDGSLDTGLTLRTIHLSGDLARVRVGATLLTDSDPQAEEAETRLKASALLDVLLMANKPGLTQEQNNIRDGHKNSDKNPDKKPMQKSAGIHTAKPLRALMIDHQDSFVLTLASAFRAQGVEVQTLRPDIARQYLQHEHQELPDLVVLSPGPGRPQDFDCAATLALCEQLAIPVFGVCLGLQAMVEYAGGMLGTLATAVHGKSGRVSHNGEGIFRGLPEQFNAGRYHSLHAAHVPKVFEVTATTSLPEPCVMAIAHIRLPWSAVQFHPESLMSMQAGVGERLIENVVDAVRDYQRHRVSQSRHDVRQQLAAV